ncbi:MAG: hypothetical protein Q4B08_09790, partial [Propionibacteriaceae bacterium]|nr:hypothetical protein [Propionibacteriaceae bacterium]
MAALLAAVWSTPKRLLGVCSGTVRAASSSAVTERTSPRNTIVTFSQTPAEVSTVYQARRLTFGTSSQPMTVITGELRR